jgi:hypothetical protein
MTGSSWNMYSAGQDKHRVGVKSAIKKWWMTVFKYKNQ